MSWNSFREWLLITLLGVIGFFTVRQLDKMENSLGTLTTSVGELNAKMGIMVFRTDNHEVRLMRLEEEKEKKK